MSFRISWKLKESTDKLKLQLQKFLNYGKPTFVVGDIFVTKLDFGMIKPHISIQDIENLCYDDEFCFNSKYNVQYCVDNSKKDSTKFELHLQTKVQLNFSSNNQTKDGSFAIFPSLCAHKPLVCPVTIKITNPVINGTLKVDISNGKYFVGFETNPLKSLCIESSFNYLGLDSLISGFLRQTIVNFLMQELPQLISGTL